MAAGIFRKLLGSLVGSDIYIMVAALITLGIFCFTLATARSVQCEACKEKKNIKRLRVLYTIFLELITIFPLLGMLGTVFGLLGLDLAAGDMENLKNNFFIALTSTAWGIIFSVVFKLLNAVVSNFVESQLLSDNQNRNEDNDEKT